MVELRPLQLREKKSGMMILLCLLLLFALLYFISYGPFIAMVQDGRGDGEMVHFLLTEFYAPHQWLLDRSEFYASYIEWWIELGERLDPRHDP